MARDEGVKAKLADAEGLIGPADTADASVMVSTTAPRPDDTARAVGTVSGTAVIPARADADADDSLNRFEIYEVTTPDGQQQWMRRDVENGHTEKVAPEVAQDDRDARARQAAKEAADAARLRGEAADAEAQRAARAARAANADAADRAAGVDQRAGR